ncbi:MAG: type II toxin-antitoxin system death-on-curing family toxin [Patescibacteria group bacterium]
MDERWAKTIEDEFQLTALSQDRDDPLRFAARLFYRIIKNHRFIDGNKRSAVLNVYFFVALNGFDLQISPKRLYSLTKDVAQSDQDQEVAITQIAKRFAEDWRVLVRKD